MFKHRGHRVFNWIITTTHQPGGAPLIDKCIVCDNHGNYYRGRAFRLSLRKRDTPTLALVVGKWEFNEIEQIRRVIDRTVARCAIDAGKLRDRVEAEHRAVTLDGKITIDGKEVGTIVASDIKIEPVLSTHEAFPPIKADERICGFMETRDQTLLNKYLDMRAAKDD